MFRGRLLDLRQSRGPQGDPALIGEPNEVYQHVRELIGHSRVEGLLGDELLRVIGRQPLQELGELAYLTDHREEYRLRVLELLPVALLAERTGCIANRLEVGHSREYAACPR